MLFILKQLLDIILAIYKYLWGNMEYLKIVGGKDISGSVEISGAKNAALPLIACTILGKNEITIGNLPNVVDINTFLKLNQKTWWRFYKRFKN
jgi:UDP-N-acetylglucosamine 1-carboxyvinyltransferase